MFLCATVELAVQRGAGSHLVNKSVGTVKVNVKVKLSLYILITESRKRMGG